MASQIFMIFLTFFSKFKFCRKNASYVTPLAMKFTEKQQYHSLKLMAEKTRFELHVKENILSLRFYIWSPSSVYKSHISSTISSDMKSCILQSSDWYSVQWRGNGGGTFKKFYRGGPARRSNPLPFVYHLDRKGKPFVYQLL